MKALIAGICLLFSITFLSAQSRFGGGVYAGLAVSQISGDELSGFNRPGATIGGFVNYGFKTKYWVQAELGFIQKGSYKAPKNGDYTKYSLNLNYMQLPVLFRFMPVGNSFVFELGPSFSYLINYTERSEIGDINQTVVFKKYEVAVMAGINYRMGSKGWWVNLRGEQSLLPVRNHQGNAVFRLNRGQYNSTLCLSLRYQFGNGGN